eukprot:m.534688 g.534688  ORF g.534688 m.534688 type:complete len:59 (-) comp22058_c0_seq4:18-194(-)
MESHITLGCVHRINCWTNELMRIRGYQQLVSFNGNGWSSSTVVLDYSRFISCRATPIN